MASRIRDLRHGDINTPLFSDRATQIHHDGQIVGLSGKALSVQLSCKFGLTSYVKSQNLHTWFVCPAIGNWYVCIVVCVHICAVKQQVIIIIIIIIFIYCNWVVTRWQWLFYMYTKHEIGYYWVKSGGLHEKHVVATWDLGNHLSISF